MAVIEVTEKTFENEVKKADETVLVDFNAGWCGPCRMLKPVLEQLSEESGNVKFVSVDIDENDEIADEYDVTSIPCLVLVKDGVEIDRHVGFIPKDAIVDFIGDR